MPRGEISAAMRVAHPHRKQSSAAQEGFRLARSVVIWPALLVSLLGFIAVIGLTQASGVGVSPDSTNYLSAADDISAGRVPRGVSGQHLDLFPPLFPALIAGGIMLGLDGATAARLINALAFSLTLLLWCVWSLKSIAYPPLKYIAVVLLAAAPPLLYVSMFVWSEPVFILLTSMSLLALLRYVHDGRKFLFAVSVACLALACLVRYSGFGLALASVPLICVGAVHLPVRRRLLIASAHAAVACLPCGLWMLLNVHYTGRPMGQRPPAAFPLLVNAKMAIATIVDWFNLAPVSSSARYPGIALTALLLLVVLVHLSYHRRPYLLTVPAPSNPLPFVFVAAAYTLFMIYSASTTAVDDLRDRLMSPVYPIAIAALVLHMDHAPALGVRRRLRHIGLVLCAVLAVGGVLRTVQVGASWVESNPTVGGVDPATAVAELQAAGVVSFRCPVYSNNPHRLYYLGRARSKRTPIHRHYKSTQTTDDLAQLVQVVGQHQPLVRVVWFHDVYTALDSNGGLTLEELRKSLLLTPQYQGRILTVYSAETATGRP